MTPIKPASVLSKKVENVKRPGTLAAPSTVPLITRALTPNSVLTDARGRSTSKAVDESFPGEVSPAVAAASGTWVVQGARPHSKPPLGTRPPLDGQGDVVDEVVADEVKLDEAGDDVDVAIVVVVQVGPQTQAERYRSGAVPHA